MLKRHYPLQGIKYWYAYNTGEICSLYAKQKLHQKTILKWLKMGLKKVDGKKPILIYGNDLKEFLGKQNKLRKNKTELAEIFCLKCREPKIPYKKQIAIEKRGNFHNIKAVCPTCKSKINKGIGFDDFAELKKLYAVVDVSQLYDCNNSPRSTPLQAQNKVGVKELSQMQLF